MKKILLFLFVSITCSVSYAVGALGTDKLTCERLENPLGIDTKTPAFSWTLIAAERNQSQTAYELIVSDNMNDVNAGRGNVWTSGKISSAQGQYIIYKGVALSSFTRYYWRIKVYDKKGEASSWSKTAWFETAFLDPAEWKASWIGDGSKNPERDEDYYKDDRMPLVRKEFAVSKKLVTARLYISGLGYYEAYLNGKKISDNVLDPGFTTYRKEVLYVVHDITPLVSKGQNVMGVMLGSGWWNPLPFKFFGRWDLRDYQQIGRAHV